MTQVDSSPPKQMFFQTQLRGDLVPPNTNSVSRVAVFYEVDEVALTGSLPEWVSTFEHMFGVGVPSEGGIEVIVTAAK